MGARRVVWWAWSTVLLLCGGCYRLNRSLADSSLAPPRAAFDAIVVPGCPARPDGKPSTCIERRVTAAVAAWRAGEAPRLLLSGGAAHNRFIEAQVMADLARSLGVPDAALIVEPNARHTVSNLRYAADLLLPRGLRRVLVVTDALQLPWALMLADWVGFDARGRLAHPDLPARELRRTLALDGWEPVPRAWWR